MKIQTAKDLKIGDIVKVDHMTLDGEYKWTGMCNWHDGSTDDNGKPVGNAVGDDVGLVVGVADGGVVGDGGGRPE